MSPTQEAAMRMALEALELLQNAIYNIGGEHVTGWDYANYAADSAEKPITTLKAALAEPVEPVAWYCKEGLKRGVSLKQESPEWIPLYTKEKP